VFVLQIGLFVLGVVLLVIGYRKSNRNLLLAAALLLCMRPANPS